MKVVKYLASWFDNGALKFAKGSFHPVTDETSRHVELGAAEFVDAPADAVKAEAAADKAESKADDASDAADAAREAAEAAAAAKAISDEAEAKAAAEGNPQA